MQADGRPVVDGNVGAPGGLTKETREAPADRSVSILLQDDTAMKRVTIMASPETGLATPVGAPGAVAVQSAVVGV
ncbi:hypothetical protein SBBP1_50058 [Burkholderiales bacterium]|nr:hypothetical protein SBBP1_50058 [Burkholderiales bacterium]